MYSCVRVRVYVCMYVHTKYKKLFHIMHTYMKYVGWHEISLFSFASI